MRRAALVLFPGTSRVTFQLPRPLGRLISSPRTGDPARIKPTRTLVSPAAVKTQRVVRDMSFGSVVSTVGGSVRATVRNGYRFAARVQKGEVGNDLTFKAEALYWDWERLSREGNGHGEERYQSRKSR